MESDSMTSVLLLRYWREILGITLGAVLAWKGYDFAYDNGVNATTAKYEKVIASYAEAEAQAQKKARAAEQSSAAAIAKIDAEMQERIRDAQAESRALVDSLRAGNQRLRDIWSGHQATDRVSSAAASPGELDEEARLRAESLGRVHTAVAECEVQVSGLQKVVIEDRK